MLVSGQLEKGYLVCPSTGEKLIINKDKGKLVAYKAKIAYKMLNHVPILLSDRHSINKQLKSSQMTSEYEAIGKNMENFSWSKTIKLKFINFLKKDVRTKSSKNALKFFDQFDSETTINLAIGGGPQIHHKVLTNVNIAPFKNVDVVADAHNLPYTKGCVSSIYCEAVLEHLYDPALAVKEMYRVLKKGGLVYCCTPFMQSYHGYPHHYQNLTLTGQKYLFESAGFKIKESDVCVGPTFGIIYLNFNYLRYYSPIFLKPLAYIYLFASLLSVKYLDIFINKKENAYIMASTTYLIAKK